ncbi:zinc metallopeptidase [Proteinivorax hydrogeniformans]|uniref:Zinc metallopeptidase n=1 Tax=Proteinivorax hydrogeniformans TaxID=1826727 RepID=A0AAU8HPE3_9FIRM
MFFGGTGLFFFDSGLIYFVIPAGIFAMYAQGKVKSAYAKYSKVMANKRITGAQVARTLLDRMGLQDVDVELTSGHLSDHYDPKAKKVRLSREVHNGTSLASLAIAAHETGHANQHDEGYFFLAFRNNFVPLAQFGSSLAMPLFLIGFIFSAQGGGPTYLMDLGIAFFSFALIFQLVTLPVEFNASSRAMALLTNEGIITNEEQKGTKAVLNAAALTYIAATAVALAQLLRLILLRNSRR